MKLPSFSPKCHTSRDAPRRRRGEDGVAVVVVIAFLAILLLYVAGNTRTLHLLGRDVKSVEQQQLRRLATTAPRTNALATNLAPRLESSSVPQPAPQ